MELAGKQKRKLQVLELLVQSRMALPPAVILYNAKSRGAEFERTSLSNYLDELIEEGFVVHVDERRGYYGATMKGRETYNQLRLYGCDEGPNS